MKENLNEKKDVKCHRLEDNIVKIEVLPKVIYRFNIITIKILMAFFEETEMLAFFEKMEMEIYMELGDPE